MALGHEEKLDAFKAGKQRPPFFHAKETMWRHAVSCQRYWQRHAKAPHSFVFRFSYHVLDLICGDCERDPIGHESEFVG